MLKTRRTWMMMAALHGASFLSRDILAQNSRGPMHFTDPEWVQQLRLVNDDVMGGQSRSRFIADPEGLVFEGNVSLENNGGFASIRWAPDFSSGSGALQLTARGDGQRYQLILRTESSAKAPIYKAGFIATSQWKTHQFHPQDFEASFRGRPVDAKPLIFSEAKEAGVLIADSQPGAFRLQLRQLQLL